MNELLENQIISHNDLIFLPECVDNIYDIMSNVSFSEWEDSLSISYDNWNNVLELWYCTFKIVWKIAILDEFYTSNFKWIQDNSKLNKNNFQALSKIWILNKPVKYIWKELFGKLIDILIAKWVNSIWLTCRSDSKSIDFYKKMQTHFPDKICSVSEPINWALIIKLT